MGGVPYRLPGDRSDQPWIIDDRHLRARSSEFVHIRLRDTTPQQVQRGKTRKRSQVDKAGTGDRGASKAYLPEMSQSFQVLEPRVGDRRIIDVEFFKFFERPE